ncbi:excalibur calcium-binding domain-containing protein [Lysobacter sp. A3-1-A15]|uniref:excalibur calcium-binding domain-containing protein n=1 Tax=Novilysobacter viscosus TaxID=3098602 RepID=UPI002EDAD238
MKWLIWPLLAIAAWQGYQQLSQPSASPGQPEIDQAAHGPGSEQRRAPVLARRPAAAVPTAPGFQCDGRRHCTQMGSLEEARYFVRNCPGTRMDGDHDGEPCENDSRWR